MRNMTIRAVLNRNCNDNVNDWNNDNKIMAKTSNEIIIMNNYNKSYFRLLNDAACGTDVQGVQCAGHCALKGDVGTLLG